MTVSVQFVAEEALLFVIWSLLYLSPSKKWNNEFSRFVLQYILTR